MVEIDKKLELLERDVSDIRQHITAIEKEDMTGAVSIGSPKGLRDVDPSAHLEEYRAKLAAAEERLKVYKAKVAASHEAEGH